MKSDSEILRDVRARIGELLSFANNAVMAADGWDKFVEARARIAVLKDLESVAQPQVTNG